MKIQGRQCLVELQVQRGLTDVQARSALEHLHEANETRAHPTQIAKSLAVLTAVCAKPGDFDDAKVVLWSERLKIVLQEYPGDIALASIANWPKTENGKWWPTENEVRSECDMLMRFRKVLAHALEEAFRLATPVQVLSSEPADGFRSDPDGATAAFVRAAYDVNPDKAAAYLRDARFKDDMIGIPYTFARFALERAFPGLMAQHGVRVVEPRAYGNAGVEWAE